MAISRLFNSLLSKNFIVLVVSLVLAACSTEENFTDSTTGTGTGVVQGTTPVPVTEPAPITILSVSASKIKNGDETTLSWDSTDADSCEASGDWNGKRNTRGSEKIKPHKWKSDYTLTCSGDGGTTTDSVTVTVEDVPSPVPVVNLSVSPSSIEEGQSAILSWTSTYADSCTATGGWSGTRSISGTFTVSPAVTSTYSLTCTGAGGSTSNSVSVTVNTPPPPIPVVNLSVSPSTIEQGQSASLSWTSTDADSCVASGGWTGARTTTGSVSISPSATSNYILTCSGPGGSTSDSVRI